VCRGPRDQEGIDLSCCNFLFLVVIFSEGETFPEVEPSEPLVTRFSTLWYTNDMAKQWRLKDFFHTY
jgi:hypothetical protein